MLLGRTGSADVALSVVATAVVALSFDRVQSRLEALSSRLLHKGVASPYDVLSRFSRTVSGRYVVEELPERMAQVLAEGTGAAWSEVWLVGGDRPTLAATWPPDAVRPGDRPGPTVGDGAGPPVSRRAPWRGAARRARRPGAPARSDVVGGGAPVRRPRRSGGDGAARCPPPDRARAAGRRAVGAGRGAHALAAAPGRRPGRGAGGRSSATSTTAPSSTWSPSR